MDSGNRSEVAEFILLGLSNDPSIQVVLFLLFLAIYTATLAGNALLILVVAFDQRLHNSMYFFLTNLSLLDIGYTSVTIPKMLVNFLAEKKTISFIGCFVQVFLFHFLGVSECILLTFMAYDRYVAICNPLRYNMVMNRTACGLMVSVVWVIGCIIASTDIFFILKLTFCGPNTVNHFFCEATSIDQLACSNLSINNIIKLFGSVTSLLIPLSLIFLSYLRIISALMKLHSGKYKAFSTCFSHLIVVVIYFGTAIFLYITPKHVKAIEDKNVSLLYTTVTPLLNPLIYSLRNKDVHKVFRKLISRVP
ncbi:olfactory receptor 7G3-like, partial [Pelobates fuscus]|uniref:olfactory receptor 7G3-like n=1 Tax=Pelobates fuscus TaxID=191477 RepID=UPI002FE4C2DD